MSILEVVVTVALLSVLLAWAFGSFASLQAAAAGAAERTQNISEARVLMDRSTRDLRSAVRLAGDQSPFVAAKPTEVTYYALLDATGRPTRVHFYVDSRARLVEETTPADAQSTAPNYTFTAAATVRMVGQYIVNATTSPPFSYYDHAGAIIGYDPSCTCLSADALLGIDSIGMTFSVRHSTNLAVAATSLVNRVRLPNIDDNPLAGPGTP